MFRAYDSSRERLVAVKLFKLDLPPERAHQLVAEFERLIAADLTHPALAAPLATGISGVSPFLAHEYVAADSLDLAVREYGPAPTGNALRVAAQLAGAIDFAAAVQVGHGALHPRDVLLSSDDTRLTGLGITRALERVGIVAPVRRPYTAPERIAGAEWDRRADVFSLAALIHELIWGRRVSGVGTAAAESLTEIAGGNLAALQDVFARALAEHPGDRYETALGFAEALTNACPDIAVTPQAPPPAKRRSTRQAEPRLPLDREPERDVAPMVVPTHDEPALTVRPAPEQAAAFSPADLDITPARVAEPEVRIARPDIVIDEPAHETAAAASPGFITGHDPDALSALERTRAAVWPLVLALLVGIAIGFAGGFFAGSREQPARAPVIAAAPAARDLTDVAASPAATPPPAVAPPPAPVTAPKADVQKPQATLGRLLVRSTPAGATVSVDGKDYGRTPATVPNLALGTHRLKVTRDGYAPAERRVVISASRPAPSLIVALDRARPAAPPRAAASTGATRGDPERYAGRLAVDSRPTGAKVFIDGRLVGTTPMALPSVSAGSHAIRLEHDGYRLWSSSVRVVASEQTRVTASLER